jgi:hypothetical protein
MNTIQHQPATTQPIVTNKVQCNHSHNSVRKNARYCGLRIRAASYLADKTIRDVPIKISLQSNQRRLHSRTLCCDGWNQPWRVIKCLSWRLPRQGAEGRARSSLTARRRGLERVTLAQLITKLSFFYTTWSFFIVFVTARQWTLSQARRTHSTKSHAVTF